MNEKPILFSGPMVRAILEGRKTQTRRAVKFPVLDRNGTGCEISGCEINSCLNQGLELCPFGHPGGRLWLRETWRKAYPKTSDSEGVVYRADKDRSLGMDEYSDRHRWKPSIFMPRWASRITLEIVSVRVERLKDISHRDALSEGVEYDVSIPEGSPLARYQNLWDSINGKKYPWKSNPWVWVIEFKIVP